MLSKLFTFSSTPHKRIHGPEGYTQFGRYKPWLRDEFTFRCVFCLTRETWSERGDHTFSVEHLNPKSRRPDLENSYENLVYACCGCNTAKGVAELKFNPCDGSLFQALHLAASGEFKPSGPKEDLGNLIINIFDLNENGVVSFRKLLLDNLKNLADQNTPHSHNLLKRWLAWPADLPDLKSSKPPGGNSKPEGLEVSYFELRKNPGLPEIMSFPDSRVA